MTRAEWMRVVARISRMWPYAPLEPDTAAEWYPLLHRLDVNAVDRAVTDLAAQPDRRFPPAVGELRAAALRVALRPPVFDRRELSDGSADSEAARRARAEIRRKLGGAPVLEEQEQW